MSEPIFTARKLESLAKMFEPDEYQRAAGRMMFRISNREAKLALDLLKEAAVQLEAFQKLKGSVAPPLPVGRQLGGQPSKRRGFVKANSLG